MSSPRSSYFYVARNGIYHLVKNLGFGPTDTILVPDYHHGNEVAAIRAAGVHITYYPVLRDLDVDLDVVARLCKARPRALYITHFIGFPQPMAELRSICRQNGVMLIEDCALALLSAYQGVPLGSFGDHSVFCLYKTVPVPNGGVLVHNDHAFPSTQVEFTNCSKVSVAARSTELMLQWVRMRHEHAGRLLFALKRRAGRSLSAANVSRVPVGDTGFDLSAVNVGMSALSQAMLSRFDYDRIRQLRRRNYLFLQQALEGRTPLLARSLTDGVCPLFFPLLVQDKQQASRVLWDQGIETVEFWNTGDPRATRVGSDAQYLRHHVLEVPIHQDISLEQLEHVARQVLRLGVGMERREAVSIPA